jgi:probable HAF family extracellular repeat protein
VGTASDAGGNDRAFSYANGVMHDLGTFGGATAAAYGVNDAGRIVGSATTAQGYGENGLAFVQINGIMYSLGALPTVDYALFSRALAINAAGRVVGVSSFGDFGAPEFPEHGFVFSDALNMMIDLGTLGGLYSSAMSINDGGWIAGRASTTLDPGNVGHTIPHAFLYINGVMFDLGALGGPFEISEAHDVNNLGQVVGWAGAGGGEGAHGFLFQGGSMLDLNALIGDSAGWTITDAAAINDFQQIAGTACRDGQCYAVRLDLPEPGTWLLMALGLGLLGWSSALTRRSTRS